MDAPEYHRLARRYEELALADPTRYRKQLRRFALLGRTFPLLYSIAIFLVAAAIVGAIAQFGGPGIVAAKVGWIVIPLIFIALRSLFVRVPPPEGLHVSRSDAPKLLAMIDELAEQARTSPPDRVLLTDEFNAAVAEVPRLAMIGGFRRYMIIGLPMMAALSPDELRSVIAHELGHVSGRHGREGVLVFRVFEGWRRIWNDLQDRSGSGPLLRFGRWYLPRLEARSFAMRRQQEIEADELARDLVGGEVAATAMLRIVTESARSERIGREMWQRRVADGAIGDGWVTTLMREFRTPIQRPGRARLFLASQLLEESGTDDEHPALADRLRTFGAPVAMQEGEAGLPLDHVVELVASPPPTTAGAEYLGERATDLAATLDRAASKDVAESLRVARQQDAELVRLEQEAASTDSESVHMQRLAMSFALRPSQQVATLAAELVERYPDSAVAHFHHGSALLADDVPSGVEHLNRSMELDPSSTPAACAALRGWHAARGEFEQAREVERRGRERLELQEQAAVERRDLTDAVPLDPPQLPDDVVEAIRAVARSNEKVNAIYVARQRVTLLQDEPPWLVAVRLVDFEYQDAQAVVQAIGEALGPVFRGISDMDVVILGQSAGGYERIANVEGCCIYSQERSAVA